jgi:NADPH:quinone reductase
MWFAFTSTVDRSNCESKSSMSALPAAARSDCAWKPSAFRIVFDPVGGPAVDTLAQAAAEEGIIIIYGGLSGQPTPYPHWPAALKGLSLRGWVASSIWNKPHRFAYNRDLILHGLAQGRLKPVIAKTFPLGQIVEAHRYLESNQQLGKIVVTV